MSLKSPISCVSDTFSLYRVSLFCIYCNFYHPMNQIFSIMSLTMMGLILGPLMRDIFIFALNNLLVVLMTPLVVLTTPFVAFVAWSMKFFFQ